MFGFIIFCLLCYLLYKFDLKYADYRLLEEKYTGNIVQYKVQRKLLNYFWHTRDSFNSKYNAESCYHGLRSKLMFRQKKSIAKTVLKGE